MTPGQSIAYFFSFRWARSKIARTQAWERHFESGMRSFGDGRIADAERGYTAAVREAEGFGEADPRLTVSLDSLVALYRLQGKHAAAEPLCLRALAIKERRYGRDHPNVASTLEDLAEVYRALGNPDLADAHRRRALAILERSIGPDFQELADSLGQAKIFENEEAGEDR